MRFTPPPGALHVAQCLQTAGHQACFVGGCVRDSLLGRQPLDWDVATSALPDEVQQLFPASVAVGAVFGTITVYAIAPEGSTEPTERLCVEVTTFRSDIAYKDGRHPSQVKFSTSLIEDLKRRDFTINAMAWDPYNATFTDPFDGQSDLSERVIRAVGDPVKRFREDALRLLRAVRFACCLEFDIDTDTWAAAEGMAHLVDKLSRERVRDELVKVLGAADPGRGLWMMKELGILNRIIPELRESERLLQGKRGAPTLLDHLIQTAAACPPNPVLRLTALLHDIGKLNTKQVLPTGKVVFYGHDEEGARQAEHILRRLRFDSHTIERAVSLIRNHMSHGPVTTKTLRRWLALHGEAWVRDLLALRRADHIASGGDQAPWVDQSEADLAVLLQSEGVLRMSDLQLNGNDIMRVFHLEPGPIIGLLLRGLYEIVLTDPSQNEKDTLFSHAERLLVRHDEQV